MKKIAYTLCLVLCLLCGACSPDGGSSPLRGLWVMEAMAVDNALIDTEADLYTWRFHGEIVEITQQRGMHQGFGIFGYFTLDGQELTLDFKGQAGLPAELMLSAEAPNHLDVTFDTSSQVILAGPRAVYYLKKSN